MSWRRVLVAAVLAGCALMVTGCDERTTTQTTDTEYQVDEAALLPVEVDGKHSDIDRTSEIAGYDGSDSGTALSTEDWATFEHEFVSLQLPDSFKGGDPTDPAGRAVLEEVAESIPDPAMRLDLLSWVRDLNELAVEYEYLEDFGPLLVVLGHPDAEGYSPGVAVDRWHVDFALGFEDADRSLESLIELQMRTWPESEWVVKNITEDRAYVVVRHVDASPAGPTTEHILFRVAGEYVYEFKYVYPGRADAHLDAVFKASIETAVVKGHEP